MYEPHLIPVYLSYFCLVWFVFLLIFSDIDNFVSLLILSVLWFSYSAAMIFSWFDPLSYIESKNSMILIDSSFALTLAMLLPKDSNAYKYALTLCFATLCHIMIISSIKTESYGFFYNWYDELIAITMLSQIWISKSGLTNALGNLQRLLRGRNVDNNSYNKNISIQKSGKVKA